MIFSCGPKDFPHTVCGVAANGDYPADVLRALAEEATKIKTTAPLIVEARAVRVIQKLVSKLHTRCDLLHRDVNERPASIVSRSRAGISGLANGLPVGRKSRESRK